MGDHRALRRPPDGALPSVGTACNPVPAKPADRPGRQRRPPAPPLPARSRQLADYEPLGPVPLLLLEQGGSPGWLLHALGLTLLADRLAHAWSFSPEELRLPSRTAGTALTLSVLAVAALRRLVQGLGLACDAGRQGRSGSGARDRPRLGTGPGPARHPGPGLVPGLRRRPDPGRGGARPLAPAATASVVFAAGLGRALLALAPGLGVAVVAPASHRLLLEERAGLQRRLHAGPRTAR